MYKPVDEIKMAYAAIVPTRHSKRQLRKMNQRHGGPSMAFLKNELTGYISCHEQAGCALDTDGQALRFDGRISVLVRKLGGVWYILRIWRRDVREVCWPVYLWREIRHGWAMVIARCLAGWRYERGGAMRK